MSYGMNEWVWLQAPVEQEIDTIYMELPHMKRHDFSLVELLVVIGIIGLLAGLLLPAVSGGRQKGMITQAKADMNSIRMALKNVETNYGQMVKTGGTNDSPTATFNGKTAKHVSTSKDGEKVIAIGNKDLGDTNYKDTYREFIRELCAPEDISAANKNINTRNIKFLDAPPEYNENDNDTIWWSDPWGNPYTVLINVNYTNKVYIPAGSGAKLRSGITTPNNYDGGWLLSGSVFLYSLGPNGVDNSGLNQNNLGDNTTDDICSWEK